MLRLDAPDRARRFLAAVARRIHAAPYETYSRYLEPAAPFRSCDQTLDAILAGDGGNCAEKAMALYFIAHSYGIPAEMVLGGEEAAGKFPYRALRSILDQRTFDSEITRDAQRYWQHYAILCHPSGNAEDDVFCDVAGSNIPFLFLDAEEASPYLDADRRTPIRVVITLEPIQLYYHRLERRQDLPLDLYYAMENFIESIDVLHTVDNELGLLHTGDYWVGAVAYRGRRELARIVGEYQRFVGRAGPGPASRPLLRPGVNLSPTPAPRAVPRCVPTRGRPDHHGRCTDPTAYPFRDSRLTDVLCYYQSTESSSLDRSLDLHFLVTLALLGLIGWAIWLACQPRSVFVIRIEGGQPRVVRGTATKAFLAEIRALCLHHGVTQGTVRGEVHGSQIGLNLRGPFPPACRQQLRNVWVMSGWSPGRPGGRRGGGAGLV